MFSNPSKPTARLTAAIILLSTVTGCDSGSQMFSDLTGGTAVPSEIADACLSLSDGPTSHSSNKFADIIAKYEERNFQETIGWEKSRAGYIWSTVYRDEMRQTDHFNRFEFPVYAEQVEDNSESGGCGPVVLRLGAVTSDGVRVGMTIHIAFMLSVKALNEERGIVTPEATPSPAAPIPRKLSPLGITPGPWASATPPSNFTPITSHWLQGSWGAVPSDPGALCETENIVTFAADGSYRDGGSYGRFRTDGRSITYFNRVLYDLGEDTEDRSEFNQPMILDAQQVDHQTMREDGILMRRCPTS